jgi:hypothetical protein
MVDFGLLKAPNALGRYHEESDRARANAQAMEERDFERGRLAQQDARVAASDERNSVLFQQNQEDRSTSQAAAGQEAKRARLKDIYSVTRSIKDPQQFEAMKPQLRAIVPDIDGETFDSIQQINQIGAQLFEQPETYEFQNLGGGGVGRGAKRSGNFEVLREPDPVAPKPEWQKRTNADGSTEWFQLPQGGDAPPAARPAGTAATGAAPRGLRNNNPLNLRPLGQGKWNGQTGNDGGYAQFASPQDGWNAAHKNLEAYGTKHGINTIAGVVSRWAPAGDNNDPQAYAATVSKSLGIPPNAPIDLKSPQVRERLLTAMAEVENGQPVQAPGASSAPGVVRGDAPKQGDGDPPPETGLKPIGGGFYKDNLGRTYQRNSAGVMQQSSGLGDPEVRKSVETVTGVNTILSSVDRFDEAVRKLKPTEFGPQGKYTGRPEVYAAAKAAATDLMMQLKGPAAYNLGVITGPDMAILEGVISDPAKFSTMITRGQIVPQLRQIAMGLHAKNVSEREAFKALGGNPEALPPVYRSRASRNAKPSAPSGGQQIKTPFGVATVKAR